MKEIVLQAEVRDQLTKGATRSLRQSGRVPGIAYGDKEAPLALSVDTKSIQTILRSEGGRNALISLKIGKSSHQVLIKEIQRHPITRVFQHVDFHRISLKKIIETKVPLHVKGEAPGVKLGGGVLEHLVREVPVRCLPTDIPAALDLDISNLQIGQSLRAKDLVLPQGVEILMDAESVIIHVVTVHVEEEAPATPSVEVPGATTEPEVIKKGKVEEGAEGASAAEAEKKPGAAAAPAKPEVKKPEGK